MATILKLNHAETPELSLKECLDQIWQSSEPRLDIARSCQGKLSRTAQMQAIVFGLASFLEVVPQRVMISPVGITLSLETERGRFEFEVSEQCHNYVINYNDINTCVRPISPVPVTAVVQKVQSFSALLCALQIVRDHIDSILYLPADMRLKRLADFANECEMALPQFRFLASSFSSIERSLT